MKRLEPVLPCRNETRPSAFGIWGGTSVRIHPRRDADGLGLGEQRLQTSVLHPVLVNAEIVKDLGVAGGGAGQKTLLVVSHQPLVGVGSHAGGHVFLGPGVQPGLKASVQAGVDPLVGLKEKPTRQLSCRSRCLQTGMKCVRMNKIASADQCFSNAFRPRTT